MKKISLKAARVNAGLYQREAAEKTGLSLYIIKQSEKHPEQVSYEVLVKLCDAYDVHMDQIFLLPDSPKSGVTA